MKIFSDRGAEKGSGGRGSPPKKKNFQDRGAEKANAVRNSPPKRKNFPNRGSVKASAGKSASGTGRKGCVMKLGV